MFGCGTSNNQFFSANKNQVGGKVVQVKGTFESFQGVGEESNQLIE